MKQSQMLLAVVVLAVMVFVVTFAMNYLGGGAQVRTDGNGGHVGPRRELVFATKVFPPDGISTVDREYRTKGHFDFWFHNPHDTDLKVGLFGQSCKCTEVRLAYLPEDASRRMAYEAAALLGVGTAGALPAVALQALAAPELQKGATEHEILRDKEAVSVPAKAIGWIRMMFLGEKPGAIGLTAVVWTEHKESGGRANLDVKMVFHEPIRVKAGLQAGTFKDVDLAQGVTRYIYVWSPTRRHLALDATPAFQRKGGPKSDPFVIGKAEPLGQEETEKFQREVMNAAHADPTEGGAPAMVMSAYRIPVTFKAMSEDGTTPFDIGPFRRRVVIHCPDVEGEARSVVILGRVEGPIELGMEGDAGDVNFRIFPSKLGKRERLTISTDLPGMKLEVDTERSSTFLKATLQPMSAASEPRQTWRLTVEVLPGQAFGPFPRKEDPKFEDCAVYLKGTGGGLKEPRSIRIAVQGTASGD